jgi:hypothetical protein
MPRGANGGSAPSAWADRRAGVDPDHGLIGSVPTRKRTMIIPPEGCDVE